jgi:bifunctional UDP-N-acetylglucosamine pyrophosphorylase / glucosamine-1-phosphate N-acetyltransferase
MPLVRHETLFQLLELHVRQKATLSLVSLITDQPYSYGRVVRDSTGQSSLKIIEASDCTPGEFQIKELNLGIYAVDSAFLRPAVESLDNSNAQGEYYLTDIVARASKEGQTTTVLPISDPDQGIGVNDLLDLTNVNQVINKRRVRELILSGVAVQDPSSLYIEKEVRVATGARIGPQVQLLGATAIEEGVQIDGMCLLKDTTVRKNAHLKIGLHAEKAVIGQGSSVGPFAHLREGTTLGDDTRIGNFVETKKAFLGAGSKAGHLTYLGDCTIGQHTNIGAGTITCNYDGYKKSQTNIGNNVFIGSNTALVAPVSVADGAVVGAGSVITRNVEKDSLAVTRAPQVSKPNWAKLRREKHAAK